MFSQSEGVPFGELTSIVTLVTQQRVWLSLQDHHSHSV